MTADYTAPAAAIAVDFLRKPLTAGRHPGAGVIKSWQPSLALLMAVTFYGCAAEDDTQGVQSAAEQSAALNFGGAMFNCGSGCSSLGPVMNDRTSSILWTN